MPPRKKATTDDAPAPSRSSSRLQAATSAQQIAAPNAAPAPAAPATAARGKAKRARSDTVNQPDATVPKPPASKRTKKAKQVDDAADIADATTSTDVPAADADEEVDEPKKMVTVIKRGAAPVDPVSGYVVTHKVYTDTQGVWDAMLNQTDLSGNQNKNKFYVLQLLHPIGSDAFCTLFTRWGRVGENGQTQLKGPWPASQAVVEFKKQFKAKAGINWEDRQGMTAKKGKYMWLERDYGDAAGGEQEETGDVQKKAGAIIPDSVLQPEIQELCRLLFSTSIIDAHLSSMNYDARKLPLGKLAKSMVLNGFAALKLLSEVIQNPNGEKAKDHGGARAACEYLSSSYYSIIPHDFGRQRPVVIDNAETLKKELDLVDALGDMEITSKLISSSALTDQDGNPMNPVDSHFRSLGLTSMEPVPKNSAEYDNLVAYARDTHGATHQYTATVRNAFRVERAGETRAWNAKDYSNLPDGDRLLLWHGSRTTNFAGILKQGLRIAPPEAPVSGYMFGKGVYFADMMSKSANYCYSHLSNGTGLLLLCEVAAKPFHELTSASYNADVECAKNQKLATKGLGRTQPVDWKDAGRALNHPELIGCDMPAGPGKDATSFGGYLQYSEYIVYDPSQIRIRYLLMVVM